MSEDIPEPEWGEADWSETGRQLAESGKLQHSPDVANMMRRHRVLVVGAGAIGQVYGYHLKLAGAHVTVLVKPKYAADAEDGYTLHSYGVAGKRPKRHFQPDVVVSDYRELREHTFDQVWLCVSSPALHDGVIERLYESCVTAGIWVSFQPGLKDQQYLTQTVIPPERLVTGVVNFIAYQAPLPGEDLWPDGVAYFIPPWSMARFSAENELFASAAANGLQRGVGSLVGAVVPDAAVAALPRRAVLLPFVMALESMQWSLGAMRDNQAVVDLTRRATIELQAALGQQTRTPPGKWAIVQKPWFWKAALFAAPHATAFPLEGYLKYHFTKMREQTDLMVDDFVELCRQEAVEPRSLEALREQWRSRRGKILSLDPEEYDTQTGHRLSVSTPMPSAEVDDLAATSVEFRVDVAEGAEISVGDSESLVVAGLDMSSEFESEDTPPPPVAQQTSHGSDSAPIDSHVPQRQREDTPLPTGILPVPGFTDELVPIEQAIPCEPGQPGQEQAAARQATDDEEEPDGVAFESVVELGDFLAAYQANGTEPNDEQSNLAILFGGLLENVGQLETDHRCAVLAELSPDRCRTLFRVTAAVGHALVDEHGDSTKPTAASESREATVAELEEVLRTYRRWPGAQTDDPDTQGLAVLFGGLLDNLHRFHAEPSELRLRLSPQQVEFLFELAGLTATQLAHETHEPG